jgi:phosphoribosyl 1,2-cyclic phosphate phosphodiesterase
MPVIESQSSDFQFTFLGTGTSIGVPVIGCDCAVCRSDDPRNQRLRSSIFVETPEAQWVVDTGPDFRAQCLRENIRHLDAALLTHKHTDHIMGFDDLRRFTLGAEVTLPVHAPQDCIDHLSRAFDFAFNGENRYPGYFKPQPFPVTGPFSLGDGSTTVTPLPVEHGKVDTIGYRFDRNERPLLAYLPDAKRVPAATRELLKGVEVLVLDALRPKPHPTHLSFEESLQIAAEVGARRTWFTHFSCEVDYRKLEPHLPDSVGLAWDGLKVNIDTLMAASREGEGSMTSPIAATPAP